MKIHCVYFSATGTTRRITGEVARRLGADVAEYDLTEDAQPAGPVPCAATDVLVAGVPVYAGRVPARAAEALERFRGQGTPALVVCVYGNRAYDDALLELKDIVERNGFHAVAGAAFIARHSIFPQVAANRPDAADWTKIRAFADECRARLARPLPPVGDGAALSVPGHRPYKVPGAIPLRPSGDKRRCNRCGTCVRRCPTGAIPASYPAATDAQRCIVCGRCMALCPRQARRFRGLLYRMAGWKFARTNAARREPETFFAEG